MSLQRCLVALAFAYFALTPALTYGSVWNLKAHPRPNVDVTLKGHRHHGVLTRDWSTDWVLLDEAGGELRFHDYDSMAFQPLATRPPMSQAWRAMVPFYVVALAALAIAFGGALIPTAPASKNDGPDTGRSVNG